MESVLLSLRAEVQKKKSQLKAQDVNASHQPLKPLHKESKKFDDKKNNSSKSDFVVDDEERLRLEKSRQALEKKALLYDEIKGGTKVLEDDELNERFLVDFQEKIYKEIAAAKEAHKLPGTENSSFSEENAELYEAKSTSDEWVEYTDSYGRTRVCLRKDVDYMKSKVEDSKPQNILQEKWEKVEEESKTKENIHYQDVLFDEARSHGTAFMPFSRDEQEREAQQQLLKDLEAQATKAALSKDSLNRKRQKLMQERLTKVRQKKRLKLGLPIKDDDRYKSPPTSDEEGHEESKETSEEITEVVLQEDEIKSKKDHVREWDIGKPGVSSLMSQAQWIEARRKERENEFAPPTNYASYSSTTDKTTNYASYSSTTDKTTNYASCSSTTDKMKKSNTYQQSNSIPSNDPREDKRREEFAPPSTYEYYRPLTNKRERLFKPAVDIEAAISKGLSQLRKEFERK